MDSMSEPSVQVDDALLVARLKQRDRSAWEELLRERGAKLHGVALRFMRDEHDAEDVVQDALVAVWNKINSFEGRSAFTSWLYRVTANAALMALRKRHQHNPDISMDAIATERPGVSPASSSLVEQPDATAILVELGEQMRAAIDQLGGKYRIIVWLRDVDGFSLAEIVEATGLGLATIKSRLHRGRLALRKTVLPYFEGERSSWGSQTAIPVRTEAPLSTIYYLCGKHSQRMENPGGANTHHCKHHSSWRRLILLRRRYSSTIRKTEVCLPGA
jgi:RNA polymerase sigma-70 factor (ECF subfamily)